MKNQLYAITNERIIEAGFRETDENSYTMKQAEDMNVDLRVFGENDANMVIEVKGEIIVKDVTTWDEVVHALTSALCSYEKTE